VARASSVVAAAQAQRRDAQARSELAAITARRYVELGAQKFMSAGAVERPSSRSRPRPMPPWPPLAPTWRPRGRTPSAWRPSVRACASSATTCACWRPPGVVISRDAEAGSTVVAGQAVLRLIDPASCGSGCGWTRAARGPGRRAARVDRAAIEARGAPVRQGGPGGGHQRQHHRGARGPGGLDTLPQGLSTLANWPRSPCRCRPRPRPCCCPTPRSTPGRSGRRVAHRRRQARRSPVRTGQASLDGQVQVLEGLKAGDEVVVYSEKADHGRQPHQDRRPLAGSSHDQPGRPRHPAFLGQVRAHRHRPGPADRRDADHGRRVPRHGRRRACLLDNSGADLWVVQQDTQGPYAESSSLRDDVVRSVLACRAWRAPPTSPT
jgi:HlyD family secretion protein